MTAKDLEYERETHQAVPSLTPAVAAVAAQEFPAGQTLPVPTLNQIDFTTESVTLKEENSITKRMRELAGISHSNNRV